MPNKKLVSIILIVVILVLAVGSIAFFVLNKSEDTTTQTSTQEKTQEADTKAPKIENIVDNVQIQGADLWFFTVDDGSSKLAVSAEKNNEILLGRLDPNNPTKEVDWKVGVSKADLTGQQVVDHWHIFAHGIHWIIMSTPGDKESILAMFDKDFNRIGLTDVSNNLEGVFTNDMFLVEEESGIAVGHFLPGTGHKVFRFNKDGALKGPVDVGGGQFIHSNGASVEKTDSGFIIFAPTNLSPDQESSIKKITTDENWRPISQTTLISEENTNIVMATSVLLENGFRIVTARALGVADGENLQTLTSEGFKLQTGDNLPDGSSALVRYLLSPDDEIVSREVIAEKMINHPHTTLVGNLLITTWDGGGFIKLRVDKVIID